MPIRRRNASSDPPSADGELLDLPLSGSAEGVDHEPPMRGVGEVDAIGTLERGGPREGRRLGGWWLILLLAFPLGALVGYVSSSEPPVAALSTDLLEFGEVALGGRGEAQAVRITNRGEQTLWITGTTVQGEAADEFRIVADDCAGIEVAAQDTCAVRLAFEPTERGARQARVRFDGNAVGGPHTVPLIGVGVAPQLAVEPARLDFGSQVAGSASPASELRVANLGTADLELGRIELAGAAADFRRVADGCSTRRLAPGERCSVRFSFAPTAEGERRASVRIESNARDRPAEVSLVGRAVPRRPILRLDSAALDFGRLRVGEAGEARKVTIANDGNGPLKVDGVRLQKIQDATAGGAFEVVAESCTGGAVPPGGRCEIEVRFRPVAENAARSELLVDSAVSSEPHRVSLAGFGTAPHLSVDPQRLSFGEVGVRDAGRSRALRLANSGTGELVIDRVAVTGADAGSFSAAGCSGAAVPPGGECAVEVRFSPRRAGPHRADLVVAHNADERRRRLPLNGLGVAARLSVSPGRLDFGEVERGEVSRRRLVLESSGRGALEVRRLRLTGGRDAGFELEGDRCSGTTLLAGETCVVGVLFRPTSAGARSLQLVIDHSASERALEVPITATATLPPDLE